MALEPLGSMTAVQVQTTKVQPVDTTTRTGNTDVTVSSTVTPTMTDATPIVAGTNQSNANQNRNGQEGKPAPSNETVKRTVDNLNKNMSDTEAVFGIHDGTNRVTIKIVDKKTKEVIKEFPPEKTLDMIEKVWEMAGIMVDEKR